MRSFEVIFHNREEITLINLNCDHEYVLMDASLTSFCEFFVDKKSLEFYNLPPILYVNNLVSLEFNVSVS